MKKETWKALIQIVITVLTAISSTVLTAISSTVLVQSCGLLH